jgi:hypothetical protein
VRVAVPEVHLDILTLSFSLILFSRAVRMRLPRTAQRGSTETGREVGEEVQLRIAAAETGAERRVRALRVQIVKGIQVRAVLVVMEAAVRSAGHWKRPAG